MKEKEEKEKEEEVGAGSEEGEGPPLKFGFTHLKVCVDCVLICLHL